LGLPCVTLARRIDVKDGAARVERVTSVGYDVIEVPLPAVVTVSNEIGEPRYPTIKGIMAAKKIEPVVWKPDDIGLAISEGGKATMTKLFQPVFEGKCEFAEGDTVEEAAVALALRIREAKIL
jgi:electron transfer flavoprotein beta subunit